MSSNPTKFLRPPEASNHLRDKHGMRAAPQTLARWRVQGHGPEFERYGRDIVYREEALDAFAESRRSAPMHSTSAA